MHNDNSPHGRWRLKDENSRPLMRFALPDGVRRHSALVMLAVSGLLTACATSPEAMESNDPFEPVNREIYQFNMTTDRVLIAPVADSYADIVPGPARTGVRNFFTNLNQPVVFANLVLQGEFERSLETVGRFGMNTVFGLGGIIDVASMEDVPDHQTDFGLTLASWGVGEGPYIMLPFLGPSNLRDGTGRFVDRYPYPMNWNEDFSSSVEAWSLRGLNALDARAAFGPAMESLDRSAIDPYVQIRSAYRQNRRAGVSRMREINKGEDEDYSDLPDFDEFE